RSGRSLERAPDAPASPWDATDGFQLSGARAIRLPIQVDGGPAEAHVKYVATGPVVAVDGVPATLDATAIEAADAIYVLRGGRQTVRPRDGLGARELYH